MNQSRLGSTGKLVRVPFVHLFTCEGVSIAGMKGIVLVMEVVKARLEFLLGDAVGTVEGSNVLAEGDLVLIGHDDDS